MASQAIGGTAYLKIDGTQYALRGKFQYSPLTTEKTGIAGQDGVHGFTEKQIVPQLKGDLSDLGGVSVSALQNITSSVITAELRNGKTVILGGAWVSGKIDVNTEDGSYSVTFEGTTINEEVAS